ncbi:MAG: VWA domain-containing protein [Planctomycetes bacterium]|nr:VWA domain-containing protein [Planctomycetota bacterium]
MAPVRRWAAVVVRCVLIIVLTAMLGGLSVVKQTNALAVIAMVDVSGSTRRFYEGGHDTVIQKARSFLAGAERGRGPEDLLGVVAFDGRAAAIANPSRANVSDRAMDIRMAEGTNIAEAIHLGRAMIPPDAAGRLVLISDGQQTAGDGLAAAEGFGGVASAIDVVPLRYRLDHEVAVERVDAPPAAQAGAAISVRVLLRATQPTEGTLRLLADGVSVDLDAATPGSGRRVQLRAGANVEQVRVQLDDRRVHRFKAVFEPDTELDERGAPRLVGDTVAENNTGEAFTLSPGRGTVLLVDGVSRGEAQGAGLTLAGALRKSGFTVNVVPPENLPGDVLSLQEHDLVIMEDVAADLVDAGKQTALAAYVQDLGGGLVFVGGPNSFGAGGWKGSTLEPLMPVRLDLPERLITPEVAIVLVTDNSGSMSWTVLGSLRTKQEIANDAAAMAIRSLDARDLVGVITFNSVPDVLIPLGPNTNPAETVRKVRDVMPGGGTFAPPAMEIAMEQLGAAKAKIKHMVVISDGRSRGAERMPVIAAMAAELGIKVSTIGVGNDADVATMRATADRGGGEYRFVADPSALPQVLLKTVRVIRTPLIREEPFEPVFLATGSVMTAGMADPPPLGGLALTQVRDEPTVVNAMTTATGEPLLAHWQVGLGQVVAFTSDASKWAERWIGWDGYAKFWSGVVRAAARSSTAGQGLTPSVVASADGLTVRLDAVDADGKPLDALTVPATVYSPSGAVREVTLSQIAPGAYESGIPVTESGSYVAVVKPATGGRKLSPAIAGATVSEGPEYRAMESSDSLLRAIAKRTGGRELDINAPDAKVLFDRAGIKPREAVTAMWPTLTWWALILALLDIATRRVAWDRWVSRRFLGEAVQAVAAPARTLSGLKTRVEAVPVAEPSLALGAEEAARLAEAARDRRRAQKLAGSAPPIVSAPERAPEEAKRSDKEEGLLAAKRRAAKRFEENP